MKMGKNGLNQDFLMGVAVLLLFVGLSGVFAEILDPLVTPIPKYGQQLTIPPAMPHTTKLPTGMPKQIEYYEIAQRQFTQQILPAPFPKTTVWGYGSVNHAGSFNSPAYTIEAKVDKPVRVKWINGLVDINGKFLPHLLPVDQT